MNLSQMKFREFFPVFKDSILGITYMHIHNIAHRDIKPANLMKISKDKYALADYGLGINLQYREEYGNKEDDFFQIGNWPGAGTPLFLDPILYR